MSQRKANLLWLKDILEHLQNCRQQLEWADSAEAVGLVTETMLHDLERCRRLCQNLQRRAQLASQVG
jgi:hypothetical protein